MAGVVTMFYPETKGEFLPWVQEHLDHLMLLDTCNAPSSPSVREILLERKLHGGPHDGHSEDDVSTEDEDIDATTMSEIMNSSKPDVPIERVRKDRVFDDAVTDDEQRIIEQRVMAQRKRLELYERREKANRTKYALSLFPHLNEDEVYQGLLLAGHNENQLLSHLPDPEFIKKIRRRVAADIKNSGGPKKRKTRDGPPPGTCMVVEVRFRPSSDEPAPSQAGSMPASPGAAEVEASPPPVPLVLGGEGDAVAPAPEEEPEEDTPLLITAPPIIRAEPKRQANMPMPEPTRTETLAQAVRDGRIIKRPRKEKGKRCGKLRLDDAVKMAETNNFEGWSDARIRAFQLIDTNPNAYYYRFNAPNETQRNGKWTTEEKALFFKRMKEFGVNGKWGIFSMEVPGRVGYQCSNFYRHLVESKRVHDENYILDENGKAKYIFSKGPGRRRRKEPTKAPTVLKADDSDDADEPPTKKRRRRRKAKDESVKKPKKAKGDDEDYVPPGSRSRRGKKSSTPSAEESDEQSDEDDPDNPLPDFIDPITLDTVQEPAISPYGHVMGYRSWSRCLQNTSICPLSKNPLRKRELVRLTWDNFDSYRDKIVNM